MISQFCVYARQTALFFAPSLKTVFTILLHLDPYIPIVTAVAMCRVIHGETIANELMTVPLSNDTVARRVHDIAKDIKSQLIDRINGKKYALQVDRSTDVSNSAQLLAFIKYTFDGKLHEDMLFCSALEGTCTGNDIFTKLDIKIKEMELSWDNCVGICTDGAGAMVGKNKGLRF